MSSRNLSLSAIAGSTCIAVAMHVSAGPIPFQTGRFISQDREVFQGTFSESVHVDVLTIGQATFRSEDNEIIAPSSIRIYTDRNRDGAFELLSEEELRAGNHPVALSRGRDLADEAALTALDLARNLDLGRLLYVDGSAPVRIDVLLAVPLYDDDMRPDETPEAVIAGSFFGGNVTLAAIVAGSIDEPILAPRTLSIEPVSFLEGETGIVMLTDRARFPQRIGMVGADLSSDFGVRPGLTAQGYRLEIEPGNEAVFAIFGTGTGSQLALAVNEPLIDVEEYTGAGDLGGGGAGGGALGTVGRIPGRVESFAFPAAGRQRSSPFRGSAGAGGGGGFDLFDFLRELPRDDQSSDDGESDDGDDDGDDGSAGDGGGSGDRFDGPGRTEFKPQPRGGESEPRHGTPNVFTPPDDDGTFGDNTGGETTGGDQAGDNYPFEGTFARFAREADNDRSPRRQIHRSQGAGGQPVPGPGVLSVLLAAGLCSRRRRRR